jgi:putative hydrolase of the HAD superfamily
MEQLEYAWTGYAAELYQRNFDALLRLRREGFPVALLSNTNPFMMQWANRDFDGQGHSIGYFFDALYLSYECKVMKPRREIFDIMLRGQQSQPGETLFIDDGPRNVEVAAAMGMHTLCPVNNEDWIPALEVFLT